MPEGPRPVIFMAPKEPADRTHVPGIDFGPRLTLPAETISASNTQVTITERITGEDVTATMLVVGSVGVSSNSIVAFQVQGGSDNHDYDANIKATTSYSRIENGDVIIPVRARPR